MVCSVVKGVALRTGNAGLSARAPSGPLALVRIVRRRSALREFQEQQRKEIRHGSSDVEHRSVALAHPVRGPSHGDQQGARSLQQVLRRAQLRPGVPRRRAPCEATIEVDSIDTSDEKRDGHLKSPDFFDATNFGTMTFKSTGVTKQWIRLEGHRRPDPPRRHQAGPPSRVESLGGGKDPWGGERQGFSAKTSPSTAGSSASPGARPSRRVGSSSATRSTSRSTSKP